MQLTRDAKDEEELITMKQTSLKVGGRSLIKASKTQENSKHKHQPYWKQPNFISLILSSSIQILLKLTFHLNNFSNFTINFIALRYSSIRLRVEVIIFTLRRQHLEHVKV